MRFYFYAALMGLTAFIFISWAVKGFPSRPPPAVVVVRQPPDPAELEARENARKTLMTRETAESSRSESLNDVRYTTIRAANLYAAAPCGADNKEKLIKALTAYVRSYLDKRDCSVFFLCTDDKMDASAAAFSTPLDGEVKKSLMAAFSRGGISSSDFPYGTQMAVSHFTWGAGDAPAPMCGALSRRPAG
jgi:hypothetical protein